MFIRVSNRIVNTNHIVDCLNISTEGFRFAIILYLAGQDGRIVAENAEAKAIWDYLNGIALDLTPATQK